MFIAEAIVHAIKEYKLSDMINRIKMLKYVGKQNLSSFSCHFYQQ